MSGVQLIDETRNAGESLIRLQACNSYHTALQYIYDGVCGSNDDGISTSLTAAVSTKGFDLVARTTHIIVDEAQDITPLFYEFISVLV
jgi:superfamily I DNA/RNA helicase